MSVEAIIARCMNYLRHTNIDQDVVTLGEIQHRVKDLFPDVHNPVVLHIASGVLAVLVWQTDVTILTLPDDLNFPF